MKKLKLKLDGKEMLSKEQMKKINGGYYACLLIYWQATGCPDEPQAYMCLTEGNWSDCYASSWQSCAEDVCCRTVNC